MESTAHQEPVQLLWTGGWDSSFRLMQLLLVEGRAVQPIYILDTGRASTLHEVRAMNQIRAALLPRLPDASLLAPTRVLVAAEFPPTLEMQRAREEILESAWIGEQYVWLAGVAETLGWQGVELCLLDLDTAGPPGTSGWKSVVFKGPGELREGAAPQLFKYWSFPIMHLTKPRMRELAREQGFLDVLARRWFCQDPLAGRACGRCRPCMYSNTDGIEFAPRPVVLGRALLRVVRRDARRLSMRASRGAQ